MTTQFQYVGNKDIKIKVDEVYRLCDGTYFVGQNETLKRCFGIMNTKGDMWYVRDLTDDDITLLKDVAQHMSNDGYYNLLMYVMNELGFTLNG